MKLPESELELELELPESNQSNELLDPESRSALGSRVDGSSLARLGSTSLLRHETRIAPGGKTVNTRKNNTLNHHIHSIAWYQLFSSERYTSIRRSLDASMLTMEVVPAMIPDEYRSSLKYGRIDPSMLLRQDGATHQP